MIFEKQGCCWIGRSNQFFGLDGLVHGTSTRAGGISTGSFSSLNLGRNTDDDPANQFKNESIFLSALGVSNMPLALLNQVHGDTVIHVTQPGIIPNADALVTNTPNLLLVIQTADCVPLLFYDPVQKAVGAAHAGWRGTKLNIAGKTVQFMINHFHSDPSNILAFIGPSIGPCCFEVGDEVLTEFDSKYHTSKNTINLWQVNKDQLLDAGLSSDNIEVSHLCTVCHQSYFFSHRGSGGNTGRMWSVVGVKQ